MAWPARKWVKWALAGLAALLLVVALAVTWLVTTEAGLRRAVTLVESVGAMSIRVEGASGRLIGPLVVDAVEIEHPRASIRIAGLVADYEPLEILAGRISAEGAKIGEAAIRLRPATGPSRPPSFMPGWLTVAIDDAAVESLLVVAPNGTETRFRGIRGSARITRSRLEFKGVHVRSSGWAVAGASGTLFARQPLALDVTTAWSLTDDDAVAGIARATGDLERLLVDAQVAAPAKARVRAEVRDLATKLTFRGEAAIEIPRPRAVGRQSPRGAARGVARVRGRPPALFGTRDRARPGPARARHPGRRARELCEPGRDTRIAHPRSRAGPFTARLRDAAHRGCSGIRRVRVLERIPLAACGCAAHCVAARHARGQGLDRVQLSRER